MLTTTRARFTALVATGVLALGCAGTADAATQRGLVNVSATDIQVPVSVAVNACQVSVNVIAEATGNQAGRCDAVSQSDANQGGGGSTNQQGLVNISLDNVQIPIGVAANVCQVSANVIAAGTGNQFGQCDAIARPSAHQ